MGTASGMLAAARSKIGYREGHDNDTAFGAWFGMNHVPWCDIFVSWCAAHSDNQPAVGKFALCRAHAAWFKNKGRFGHTPRAGAIVFFSFTGGAPSHVGIVESVNSDGSI